MFDKYDTKFKIFGKFEFDIKWTLKETIKKLKEYGLTYNSGVSWGNLITYRVWIYSDKKYNNTKQDRWEIDFVSQNPYSEILDVDYEYPNSADILVVLRKFHRGWFRNGYYETQEEIQEIEN